MAVVFLATSFKDTLLGPLFSQVLRQVPNLKCSTINTESSVLN